MRLPILAGRLVSELRLSHIYIYMCVCVLIFNGYSHKVFNDVRLTIQSGKQVKFLLAQSLDVALSLLHRPHVSSQMSPLALFRSDNNMTVISILTFCVARRLVILKKIVGYIGKKMFLMNICTICGIGWLQRKHFFNFNF